MRFISTLLLALLGLAGASLVRGVQTASPAGEWYGVLQAPVGDLPIVVNFRQSAAVWTGTFNPSPGVTLPLQQIVIDSETISFSLVAPGSPTFRGKFSADGTAIAGEFKQGPETLAFKLTRDVAAAGSLDDLITITDASIPPSDRPFFSNPRHPAIEYPTRETTDPVAMLNRALQDGKLRLNFESGSGYLRTLLNALRIPVESQIVVFSKTSLQSGFINPSNPRAVFFTDNVAVGFIRNAPLIEIAAQDPQQGVVFYVLSQFETSQPRMVRSDTCKGCHESRTSMDVPGLLAKSVVTGTRGDAFPQYANYISDHRSPLEERWGGWYVTGGPRSVRHLGNTLLAPGGDPEAVASPQTLSLNSLSGKFDVASYPTVYSDIAALMVFNHQVQMTNLITRLGWETRVAVHEEQKSGKNGSLTAKIVSTDAREFVDYLLFVDEAPLAAKLESTSGFAAKFAAPGPRDGKGRSLRDLALDGRLMRYPCSYMIYSPAFDALPVEAKDAVYKRMWEVLSGKETEPKYRKLSSSDRAAVLEILRDTKKDLPAYFR